MIVVGVLVVGVVFALIPSREPSYGGERLSEWVEELSSNRPADKNAEAEKALRSIGTNGSYEENSESSSQQS